MRPLALLLGIAMGSSVSLVAGIGLTVAVFLFLPEYRERLHGELGPLTEGLVWSLVLAACASASFFGEIGNKPWRRPLQLALLLVMVTMGWHFWPS